MATTTSSWWQQGTMDKRERQVGHTKRMISPDHWARYSFAATHLTHRDLVLDALCGCGYGAYILAGTKPRLVEAFDISRDAITYAERWWYDNRIIYRVMAAEHFDYPEAHFSFVTCFEAIEHIDGPIGLLASINYSMRENGKLFVSTPNELKVPWSQKCFPFHKRHYTPQQLEEMLGQCGFEVEAWFSQSDKQHGRFFHDGTNGNVLVALARKQ